MQATSLPFGVVNAAGDRYHPAIIAQAAATLAEMFPGRFGSRSAAGRRSTSTLPARVASKTERNARLRECVDVIRALWAGETVSHHGARAGRSRPASDRPGEATAFSRCCRQRGDGGLGWNLGRRFGHDQPANGEAREQIIRAFRENGGEGKPLFLQIHVAYGRDEEAQPR